MADQRGGETIRVAFQVAYDGKHSDTHSMDVQELAPALLSVGRMVRETNSQLNGTKANIKLLVTSNFEHKCFNINFEIVQTVLHYITTFLQSDEVKTARGILVDLGIVGGSSGLGLFGYLKWKKSNKVASIAETDKHGVVIVQLGNGNIAEVNRDAVRLADNSKIRAAIEGILSPLGTDGIKKISFRQDEREIESLDDEDAKEILSAFALPALSDDTDVLNDLPDTVTAWLRVYSPVYDEKADKWRFYYGENPIYADIADTTITRDALKRGGALVNDLYKVKMEVRQRVTAKGSVRLDYKVIEVLDFRPAPQQAAMLLGNTSPAP